MNVWSRTNAEGQVMPVSGMRTFHGTVDGKPVVGVYAHYADGLVQVYTAVWVGGEQLTPADLDTVRDRLTVEAQADHAGRTA